MRSGRSGPPKRGLLSGYKLGDIGRRWFIAYGASLGALATAVTLIQAKVPMSWLWFLLFASIMATAWVAVVMAHSYRIRFRKLQEEALVRELYPSRQGVIAHYRSVFDNTEERFVAVGISLHSLVTERNFESWVDRAVGRDVDVHFVFCKPYGDIVRRREEEESRGHGRISQDCLSNINRTLKLKRKLGHKGERVHIHENETWTPESFIIMHDDEIYLAPYLAGEFGRNCPTFVLKRNEWNATVFDVLASHVEKMIEIPERNPNVDEKMFHVTAFGRKRDRSELTKAIFLDRDGVIIEDAGYIAHPSDVKLLADASDALRRLGQDRRLVVVTNQSGIGRGRFTEQDLQDVNQVMIDLLEDSGAHIDAIYWCPHHPDDGCECRKPRPGLILQAMADFRLDAEGSFMVGDKATDIVAGRSAGVTTIVIDEGQGLANSPRSDYVAATLMKAVSWILSGSHRRESC